MKIPCKRCASEMLFPYLRCSECGWIPQGAFRSKAIQFARRYISKNKDRKEELTIILEEEAKETLKEIPERKRDISPSSSGGSSGWSALSMGVMVLGILFLILGICASSSPMLPILLSMGVILLLISILLLAIKVRSEKRGK